MKKSNIRIMGKYLIFFVSIVIQQNLAQRKYCDIRKTHTLCKYQDFGVNCGQTGPLYHGLTDDEKDMVVFMHNTYRSKVARGLETKGHPGPQKTASNMLELTWDNELELLAQRWANQCNYGSDTERDVPRFSVGQNVYEASDVDEGPIDLKRAIDDWYNEVAEVNNNFVEEFYFKPGTGHYTQMVWAQTNKIGCGYSSYRQGHLIKKLIVCNYGKAGNLLNAPIYEVGRPCSKCPGTTCSRNFPGLCTDTRLYLGPIEYIPEISTVLLSDITHSHDLKNTRPLRGDGTVEPGNWIFPEVSESAIPNFSNQPRTSSNYRPRPLSTFERSLDKITQLQTQVVLLESALDEAKAELHSVGEHL